MHKIMLSYPLFGQGMQTLREQTNLFVSNDGEIAPYLLQLREAEAFITRNVHPTTQQLETCPKLKVIGIPGVGYQSYNLEYLNRRGIAVVYCPGMNARSVAEHAVGLAYALTKWIPRDSAEVKDGNYGIRNRFDHMELQGKTAGIAGFGAIGKETARLFQLNGMKVAVYDPFVPEEAVCATGYTYCATLQALAGISDVLSLHMPSLPTTYHLFDRSVFDAAKDGLYFINCARGSVVDEKALYKALCSGKVAAAGLDVMEKEPFDISSELLRHPNVIVTPHVGGVTADAAERTHKLVVDSTLALLDGRRITNIANPAALEHSRWSGLKP